MTIDIEEPVKAKPQRKDAIDEFHKKIIHEDTERGDFKITIGGGGSFIAQQQLPQLVLSSSGSQQQQPNSSISQSQQNHPAGIIINAGSTSSSSTKTTKHNVGVEHPPLSRGLGGSGLPMTISKSSAGAIVHEPRLIPRSLRIIPLHVRFALNGLLSNVLFTIADNWAVSRHSAAVAAAVAAAASAGSATGTADTNNSSTSSSIWFWWMFWKCNFSTLSPSAIYSILYLIFIPISHAMACIFVFGWPDRYLPSLLSNCPIGLCAMILGAALTAYLNAIQFNQMVVDYIEMVWEYIRNNFTFYGGMPQREPRDDEGGQFYSSMMVLFVTNLWTYLSSLYVNSPPQKSEKKEL